MGILRIQNHCKKLKAGLYTRLIRRDFGAIGKGTLIFPPFHSQDVSRIYLGEGCMIAAYSWLQSVRQYRSVQYSPRLEIGDGTYMGHRTHIIACGHMVIGKNVVLSDGVYVSDNLHGFEDVTRPVFPQPLSHPGPVTIEDEVWLGERVCVLPNVTIGRHSVIGSNAVVTKDIPAYSVAVGMPAKVIRTYDFSKNEWARVRAKES